MSKEKQNVEGSFKKIIEEKTKESVKLQFLLIQEKRKALALQERILINNNPDCFHEETKDQYQSKLIYDEEKDSMDIEGE